MLGLDRNLKASDYAEAVALWRRDHDQATVDEHLTNAWNDPVWLRHSYGPLISLAGRHERTRDTLLLRNRLLDKALDLHMQEEFEASTLLVLSQVDGLTFDFTEGRHGFFYRGKDEFFEDDETLMGMPEFLRAVRKSVNRDVKATTSEAGFVRSAIVHGRHLAFGTRVNSTKAFALVAGVIEWLQPRAESLTERWQREHEERFAGSDERDDAGRRRDQRGFADSKQSLRRLSTREANEFRRYGRYSPNLTSMRCSRPRTWCGLRARTQ